MSDQKEQLSKNQSKKEKVHIIDPSLIQTFLNVKTPLDLDNPIYEISQDNQIFTLFEPKSPTDKTTTFDFDKIFTDKNENSYIYEEVCKDCIKESLSGTNFLYVSYGTTLSDKHKILIGNAENSYSNINTRGILPRLLEQYLHTISSNENYKHNLTISLSYMCVNNAKVIDFSNFMGKEISNLTEKDFMNNAIEIRNNKDIISSIKKVPTENTNDVVYFINKIMNTLIKIDDDSTYHLYSWSHFAFVFYITDNNGKIVSTITFIILNGNDNIAPPSTEETKQKVPNTKEEVPVTTKPSLRKVQQSKHVIDSQFTYDSVITAISLNNTLNSLNKIQNEEEEKSKLDLSKLTTLLYHICFSAFINNMKYRIIGSITPFKGFQHIVKDTLMFLFDCKKILTNKDKTPEQNKPKETPKQQVVKADKKGLPDVKRDDLIYDLESKLRMQGQVIQELQDLIEEKENKIEQLTDNYTKQVQTLKNEFVFEGDVNILITQNEYTKEARNARHIRDALDNLRIKTKKVNELETQLQEARKEISKLKMQNQQTQNNLTSMQLYEKDLQLNPNENKDIILSRYSSQIYNEIKSLQYKAKQLEDINLELIKELSLKNQILINIPNAIQNQSDKEVNVTHIKGVAIKKAEHKYKKEIENIHKANIQEIQLIKDKYESILKEKDNAISDINNRYSNLKCDYDYEVKQYSNELINIDEILMNAIKHFKILFNTNVKQQTNIMTYINLKNEYETYLKSNEEQINQVSFPLLYKSLTNSNKLNINNINTVTNSRPKSAAIGGIRRNVPQKEKSTPCLIKGNSGSKSSNEFDSHCLSLSMNEEKKILNDKEYESMSKEELINLCTELNVKMNSIKDFAEKYSLYKKGYNIKQFEINENYVANLHFKLDKLERNIREQVDANNNNRIIMKSFERTLEKLQFENMKLKKELNEKNALNKMINPTVNSNISHTFYGIFSETSPNNYKNTQQGNIGTKIPCTTLKDNTKPSTIETTVSNNLREQTISSQVKGNVNGFRTQTTTDKYNTKTRPLSAKPQIQNINMKTNN